MFWYLDDGSLSKQRDTILCTRSFSLSENQLIAVATDGHRLAFCQAEVSLNPGETRQVIIPRKAINEISTTRAELGAFQKNTLESNVTNLRNASENMTASESNVRDADMAAEMATFTRNQIMTQSGKAILVQAKQSPKGVLRLLW